MENLPEIPAEYREKMERQGGVVILCEGKPCGWMNELRDPNHWAPGCIAVDAAGNRWQAAGGDAGNGAMCWKPIGQSPQPVTMAILPHTREKISRYIAMWEAMEVRELTPEERIEGIELMQQARNELFAQALLTASYHRHAAER